MLPEYFGDSDAEIKHTELASTIAITIYIAVDMLISNHIFVYLFLFNTTFI